MTDVAARAIAEALGDSYDDAFADKAEWIASRGEKGGRFRDINEPFQRDYDAAAQAALATHAAQIEALRAERDALREALAEEREENLWNAYHTGHEKDGRWTHMFMSDGEWLARQCGFDPRLPDYDAAEIKAAIPKAARAALGEPTDGR